MWYKSLSDPSFPADWQVCDGTNGTPDLRGRFVRGVSADADVDKPYGAVNHSHTNSSVVAADDHFHDIAGTYGGTVTSGRDVYDSYGSATVADKTHTHPVDFDSSSSGTHGHSTSDTATEDNLPPYVQVYFIMKVTP